VPRLFGLDSGPGRPRLVALAFRQLDGAPLHRTVRPL